MATKKANRMKLNKRIVFKSLFGIVLLLTVFSALVSAIGSHVFTEALLNQYSEGAFRTADAAALAVDADRMDIYASSGGAGEEYQDVWDQLDALCNATGATFIYVILPDLSDYAHITFLFSTINHEMHYTRYDFGYVRETTNDEYREKYRALYAGEAERELVVRDRGAIETDPHITAMIPLKGSDSQTKAILCVQRQMDILSRARITYLRRVTLVLIALSLLVIVGQSLYLHLVLLRPLKQISDEAERFAQENALPSKPLHETVRNRDEIGLLAGSIDQMEDRITRYVEDLTQITAEKERIGTELSLATRIQSSMLPHSFPPFPERTEFDLFASMDPAREVGGDFYDYYLIDDDHLCIVMADVSGKGVPAALFMMASKIILANNAQMGKSPAQILTDTNTTICSNNHVDMFVTVWLGILEISTGRLTAANAGHEYPILKQADGSFSLLKDKHGFVIGGLSGIGYQEYEIQLEPGARIFLYTDGLPEATDAEGNMFGIDRMLAALNEDPGASPSQVLQNVRNSVDHFVKDAEQFDDLTMLCLIYSGKENPETDSDAV